MNNLIKDNKIGVKDIVDSRICPSCFDKKHNHILYGDNSKRMLYEDEQIESLFTGNPRTSDMLHLVLKNIIKI